MDYAVFEARVLELLYKTGDRVTAQLAAYKIGVGVEKAREMLESMAAKDIVSLETDDNGGIYFDLIDRPPPTGEPLSWQVAPRPPQVAPLPPPPALVPYYAMPPVAMPVLMPPYIEPEKSVGAAAALSFFFGPFGMFYSTVTGGLVMLFGGFLFMLLTLGLGIVLVSPACVVWGTLAAHAHNQKVRLQRDQMHQSLAHMQQVHQMQQVQHMQQAQRALPPKR
jgi:hypothetical protein